MGNLYLEVGKFNYIELTRKRMQVCPFTVKIDVQSVIFTLYVYSFNVATYRISKVIVLKVNSSFEPFPLIIICEQMKDELSSEWLALVVLVS